MDQTSSEVRSEIDEKKVAIGAKLDTLEKRIDSARDQAANLFSFKHQAQERPYLVVGVAAGAGFLLGRTRLRLPVAALASIAWKAIPAGLSAVILASLRDQYDA